MVCKNEACPKRCPETNLSNLAVAQDGTEGDDSPDKMVKDARRLQLDELLRTKGVEMCEPTQYAEISLSGKDGHEHDVIYHENWNE